LTWRLARQKLGALAGSGTTRLGDASSGTDPLRDLMVAAQVGDARAYRALLDEVAKVARRVIRRRHPFLPDADVEDLVQDVLLSVHSVRATYDPLRPFIPWLIAVVRNRVADAARRHVRQKAWQVAVDEYPETADLADHATDAEPFGDAEGLRRAVAGLPEAQRTAIELTKLQELSLKEASAKSGLSEGALKIATHRAVKALRGILGSGR
jgi:RNA polymerase sigma-70 factor (ECF subfamily)